MLEATPEPIDKSPKELFNSAMTELGNTLRDQNVNQNLNFQIFQDIYQRFCNSKEITELEDNSHEFSLSALYLRYAKKLLLNQETYKKNMATLYLHLQVYPLFNSLVSINDIDSASYVSIIKEYLRKAEPVIDNGREISLELCLSELSQLCNLPTIKPDIKYHINLLKQIYTFKKDLQDTNIKDDTREACLDQLYRLLRLVIIPWQEKDLEEDISAILKNQLEAAKTDLEDAFKSTITLNRNPERKNAIQNLWDGFETIKKEAITSNSAEIKEHAKDIITSTLYMTRTASVVREPNQSTFWSKIKKMSPLYDRFGQTFFGKPWAANTMKKSLLLLALCAISISVPHLIIPVAIAAHIMISIHALTITHALTTVGNIGGALTGIKGSIGVVERFLNPHLFHAPKVVDPDQSTHGVALLSPR